MTALRHVTTSFILVNDEILLLKRSNSVHTYPLHWAGISGSMETNDAFPIDCAMREIEEETGLVNNVHISLLRSGRWIEVDSRPKYDRVFRVHPFLFQFDCSAYPNLKDVLKLDWEHSEYKLVSHDDFQKLCAGNAASGADVVPNLADALDRVFVSHSVAKLLQRIKTDKESGANLIMRYTIEGLISILKEIVTTDMSVSTLKDLAFHFSNARPIMSCIRNSVCSIIAAGLQELLKLNLNNAQAYQAAEAMNAIYAKATALLRSDESSAEIIAKKLASNVNVKATVKPEVSVETITSSMTMVLSIVTISKSSTVESVLVRFAELLKSSFQFQCLILNITVMESSPTDEGHAMAEKLGVEIPRVLGVDTNLKLKLNITVVPDSAIFAILEQEKERYSDTQKYLYIQWAVVGADSFGEDYFVNKTGTRILTCVCPKIFVVTSSMKVDIEREREHALHDLSYEVEVNVNETHVEQRSGYMYWYSTFERVDVNSTIHILTERDDEHAKLIQDVTHEYKLVFEI